MKSRKGIITLLERCYIGTDELWTCEVVLSDFLYDEGVRVVVFLNKRKG